MTKQSPKTLRVCTGTGGFQARCLLWAKPGSACLFQPGWVWERFPPPLPLHLSQKVFENPRFLPSPAISPALGNRRLKEKQTKAPLCSGELMGHEAATPPLLRLPSRESALPIVCSSSRHVKGLLGVAVTSKPGLGLREGGFFQLSKLQNTSEPFAVPVLCAFPAGLGWVKRLQSQGKRHSRHLVTLLICTCVLAPVLKSSCKVVGGSFPFF